MMKKLIDCKPEIAVLDFLLRIVRKNTWIPEEISFKTQLFLVVFSMKITMMKMRLGIAFLQVGCWLVPYRFTSCGYFWGKLNKETNDPRRNPSSLG